MHNVVSKRGVDVAKTQAEDKKKQTWREIEKESLWECRQLLVNDSGLHYIQQDQSMYSERNPINGLKLEKRGFGILPVYNMYEK